MFRRWLLGLLMLLMAPGLWSGALAASEEAAALPAGALAQLQLSSAPAEYAFTPTANGLYGVYVFPGGEDVRAQAEILLDGEMLVRGDGTGQLVTCRLNANTQYTLQVTGSGSAMLEIARETLSRSFSMPLELDDGEGYSKLIARPGDVHWYSITAQSSGAALLACAPESPGFRLKIEMFDGRGRRTAVSETLASGAAVLSAQFSEGTTCFLRISGSRDGKYTLTCQRSENAVRAQSVNLSARELTIPGHATEQLSVQLYPEGACDLIYLDSTDRSTAIPWSTGYVEGLRDGASVVTVYAYGGARSSCRITVEEVPVQSVALSPQRLTVTEGESRSLLAVISPYNATQRQLKWKSRDESIAAVDKNGVVTALGQGETEITVTAQNGFEASVPVTVRAALPKYRALLVGEQNYAPTVETVREGSENSVRAINSLLNTFSYSDGGYYEVQTLMDGSRDAVLAAVRETFADARAADTSLLYITCHGYYRAGMTFFLMADGSVLSAADLERELRMIPGEIVLLIDCCGSGGMIGEASSPEDILDGVMEVFHGTLGGSSIRGSKYRIIASAYLDQDSYRVGFSGGAMSTVFARALCDAAGWGMDTFAPSALNADVNYDGAITLDELGAYLSKRVMWYLSRAGAYTQTVCVYPPNDPSIVFERGGE